MPGLLVAQTLLQLTPVAVAVAAPPVTVVVGTAPVISLNNGTSAGNYVGFNGDAANLNPQDVTAAGATDWKVWGINTVATDAASLAGDARKAGGAGISDLTDLEGGGAIPLRALGPLFVPSQVGVGATHVPFDFAWTDGTPAASAATGTAGLQHNNSSSSLTPGYGFSFTVPVTATPQRLSLWVSAHHGQGLLTVSQSGFNSVLDDGIAGGQNHGGVYSIDFVGTPSQTLTVRYVLESAVTPSSTVDSDGFASTDANVVIYAAALAPAAAVVVPPVAAPALSGIYHVGHDTYYAGRISATPNTTYDVALGSAAACPGAVIAPSAPTFGTVHGVTTDSTGAAFFRGKLLGAIPSGPYVAAKISGPAGANSPYSPCVIDGPDNDTWPRAFPLTLSGPSSEQTAATQGWLDLPGRERWFRFTVQPGAHVQVDLTNLPADYDLVLFKDIGAAYTALTSPASTTDLSKLSAEFASSGFTSSGFTSSGFTSSGFTSSGFTGGDPFSGAQTRSLVAIASTIGMGDEHVAANTWTNSGQYYIRVSGKNGASSLAQAFSLTVTQDGGQCDGVTPISGTPTGIAGGYKTIILTDSSRLPNTSDVGALMDKLDAFKLRDEVTGKVIDLASVPRVQQLQTQADIHAQCVYAKNLVADAIRDIVTAYRTENSSTLAYVVLAGGDDVIPFFRNPDLSNLGQEAGYVPPVKDDSASQASLRENYVLSQDAYGAGTQVSLYSSSFAIPDLAVGRLVETPSEISGMIDAYTATDGVVTPHSSLVTGYDFLTDAARAAQADLLAGTNAAPDTLITGSNVLPTDPSSWTAAQLKSHFVDTRHDLVFLAGHFSANSALAADFKTSVLTTDLATSTTDLSNEIVLSIGCHSGYNIVDGAAIADVTLPLDWAQALAQKKMTGILGTGYQYGDTEFIEYSERLYTDVAHLLRYGTGPVALGKALVQAKLDYLQATPDIRGIHEKALREATLYGLPMLGIDLPSGRGLAPATDATIGETSGYAANPGLSLGLQSTELTIDPALLDQTKTLQNADGGGTLDATYLKGPNGVVSNPGEPVLPLDSISVGKTDYVLRGIGLLDGTYHDRSVVPLTGAPATELKTAHTSFDSTTFFPSKLWTPNYYGALSQGGDTRLLVTPAQHRAINPGDSTVTLRQYDHLHLKLFYSNDTSDGSGSDAPSITDVSASVNGADVTFSGRVVGDPRAGVQEVWVTYTGLSEEWASVELHQNLTDSSLWVGTLHMATPPTSPTEVDFMIQAVNGFGLVGLNDNVGSYHKTTVGTNVPPTATSLSLATSPASGSYGSTAHVAATLSSGATPVAGKTIAFTIGSVTRSGTTNSSGVASADVPLSSALGPNTVSATFGGDATTVASGDSRLFTIAKIGTSISLPAATNVTYGAPTGVTAALTDDNDTPLGSRTIYFVVSGAAGQTSTVITDFTGHAMLGALTLPPGAYTLTAYFNGEIPITGQAPITLTDGTYQSSSQAMNLTITPATPSLVFTPLPDRVYGTGPFDISTFATSNSTGAKTFGPGGASAGCSVTSAGVVSLTGASITTSCVITVSQAADTNYVATGPLSQSFHIAKATPVLALGVLVDRLIGTGPFDIHASATSNSPVAITFSTTTPTVCSVDAAGVAMNLIAAGACTITVSQAANANYNAAGPATRSFMINKKSQTITFTSVAPTTAVYGDAYSPTATSTSGLAVTFTVTGGCSFVSPKVTMTSSGSCTVTANQGGNGTWLAATPVSQTITVGKKGATLGYTGNLFWSAGSGTSTSVTFTGRVTPASGGTVDTTKAAVDFLLFSSTNFTTTPTDHCLGTTTAAGVATCTKTLGLDNWTVIMSIPSTNTFFTAPNSDAVVLTVFQGSAAKYATGAGYIIEPSSSTIPVKTSLTSNHGSFGFAVSYKTGTTPQGVAVYTFRGIDGYDYVFTTSSWTGGGLSFTTGKASFSNKCTVTVINPVTRKIVTALGGTNFTCRFDVTDGSPDKLAISVYTSAGVLYHQAGTATTQISVTSGNIVVH